VKVILKIVFLVGSLAFLPFLMSCKPLGAGQNFDISLSSKQVLMINATTSSCAGLNAGTPDTSITGIYFQLQNMTVSWPNTTSPITLQWVQFSINSADVNNGQTFICQIAGTDLLNAWIQQWNVTNPTTGNQVCYNPGPPPSGISSAPQSVTLGTSISTPADPTCDVAAYKSSCGFKCGGITMTDPTKSSSGSILLQVYATYDSGGGNLVPLILSKTLTYYYQGTGG